nr:MAG TPA: hypothetical protein [Caudoviricetes sp.]DAO35104.1 MAG TPA: hypothetical protein [Caudoviricetes sp.]
MNDKQKKELIKLLKEINIKYERGHLLKITNKNK